MRPRSPFHPTHAASQGGAAYFGVNATVTGTLIVNASARDFGGGVFFAASGSVVGATIVQGSAGKDGGGVFFSRAGEVRDSALVGSEALRVRGPRLLLASAGHSACICSCC